MRRQVEQSDKEQGERYPGLPRVSVVVPVRNEAGNVQSLLTSLSNQTYAADRTEIIVVDGDSTDRTYELVEQFIRGRTGFSLLRNPRRIAASALNLGIRAATGDIIIRVDGHADLADDFIDSTVDTLRSKPDVDCVGGVVRHVGRTPFGKACALAMKLPFTVGGAKQHYQGFEGYDQNVAFPGFRRGVFERVGFFDENLVRNQDDEFIYRMLRRGLHTYITPAIRYQYHVRETPRQLFRQYFQYGFWRIPMMLKFGRATSVRQCVPLISLVIAGLLVAVSVVNTDLWYLGLLLPSVYFLALTAIALQALRRHPPQVAINVPLAIAIIHSAYALGMGYGWLSRLLGLDTFKTDGKTSALSR